MKKILSIVSILLLLFSCKDDDNTPKKGHSPAIDEEITMEEGLFSGFVKDAAGNYLSGVIVTTGEIQTMTNEFGSFQFDQIGVVSNRTVLKFSKEGYFEIVRSNITQEETTLEVILTPKGNSTITCETTFNSSSTKQLQAGEMQVNLPAEGVVVKGSQTPYTGIVKADMLYLDPNDKNFTTRMPGGDMTAIRSDNSETMLVSYGMVNVNLTAEDGTPLQLKEGKPSTLSFPIPEGMENNPPATMPLWHFNETAGIWVESGVGTLQGDKYVGEVSHFSYVNLDYPETRATIEGTVTNPEHTPVPYLKVHIGQTYAYTDVNGFYSAYVPANTPVKVSVYSEDYGNYDNVVIYPVPAISGKHTYTQNVKLPSLYSVKGKIVNNCSDHAIVTVSLSKKNYSTSQTTKGNGEFCLQVEKNYTGPMKLDISTADTTISKDIQVYESMNLGTIDICDPHNKGGKITIYFMPDSSKKDSLSYTFEPAVHDGCFIFDQDLVLFTNEDDLWLKTKGYSPEKTQYNQVEIAFGETKTNGDWWEFQDTIQAAITTQKKDLLAINLFGEGMLYRNNYAPSTAQLKSSSLIAPVIVRGTYKKNVSSLQGLNFPDYITIPTPIDLLELITESSVYGTGGYANYKIKEESDYNRLKAEIKKLNFQLLWEDVESEYKEIYYQQGDKVIGLSFDKRGMGTLMEDDNEYQLNLFLLEGCKVNLNETRSGSNNSAIRKLVHRLKHKYTIHSKQ